MLVDMVNVIDACREDASFSFVIRTISYVSRTIAVERTAVANDGRTIDVALTSEGAELVAQLHSQVQLTRGPLTDHLSAAERRLRQQLLQRMLERPQN